jgi:hypothetical protein
MRVRVIAAPAAEAFLIAEHELTVAGPVLAVAVARHLFVVLGNITMLCHQNLLA